MKKALVTGASEGIGREFAVQLAQAGYQVTVVARNQARLDELVSDLNKMIDAGHEAISADLVTEEGIEKISALFTKGQFDVLINNAGVGASGTFLEGDYKSKKDMLRLNCEALMALSHSFLSHAKAGDAMINVASVLAFIPLPRSVVYSATKAFVATFSETLWLDQKEKNVFVTCLCPGMTRTQFQKRAGMGEKYKYLESITQNVDVVVACAMKALKKRNSPFIFTGVKNFITASLPRFMSAKMLMNIAGRVK